MIRGLYSAASSMMAITKRMEVATTNLANIQTNGFKQERTGLSTFAEQLVTRLQTGDNSQPLGSIALSGIASEPETDWSQGSLQTTNRELDFALAGGGFFTVQAPEGIRYTRNGAFTRNGQGELVTSTGRRVVGNNGPIQLPDGEVAIEPDGSILVDGQVVDRLRIVEFADMRTIRRYGNNELGPEDPATQPQAAVNTTVRQGTIEGSNVDVTATMTTILEIQRAYEANQRMIQSENELTTRAVNDIARPAG